MSWRTHRDKRIFRLALHHRIDRPACSASSIKRGVERLHRDRCVRIEPVVTRRERVLDPLKMFLRMRSLHYSLLRLFGRDLNDLRPKLFIAL
jgi:hypothetical protein